MNTKTHDTASRTRRATAIFRFYHFHFCVNSVFHYRFWQDCTATIRNYFKNGREWQAHNNNQGQWRWNCSVRDANLSIQWKYFSNRLNSLEYFIYHFQHPRTDTKNIMRHTVHKIPEPLLEVDNRHIHTNCSIAHHTIARHSGKLNHFILSF